MEMMGRPGESPGEVVAANEFLSALLPAMLALADGDPELLTKATSLSLAAYHFGLRSALKSLYDATDKDGKIGEIKGDFGEMLKKLANPTGIVN